MYLVMLIRQFFRSVEVKDNSKPTVKSEDSTRTFSDFFKSMKTKIVDLDDDVLKSEPPKKKLAPKMPTFGFDPAADPVFGLRMINPLLSSRAIQDKMIGKKPVPVSRVSIHLNSGDVSDWVVAGVLVNKSLPKTSQKGISCMSFNYINILLKSKLYF